MGKVKELSTVLDEIVTCGETLVQGAEKLKDMMEIMDSLAECGKTLISSGKALREYFSSPAEDSERPVTKKKPKTETEEAPQETPMTNMSERFCQMFLSPATVQKSSRFLRNTEPGTLPLWMRRIMQPSSLKRRN